MQLPPESYDEEDLNDLTWAEMQVEDLLSPPESNDEVGLTELRYAEMQNEDMLLSSESNEEEDLDNLRYAEMQKEDMLSLPGSNEEEDLDNLRYEDMKREDMMLPSESSNEEKIIDLTYIDMEGLEQKEISENSLKTTYNEPKPSGSTQVSDNHRPTQASDLHIPNLLLAREIIRKYYIKRMSKDETGLWHSNGHSYVPLTREELEAIVYKEIPYEVKVNLDSCSSIKRNVAEYVRDEIELRVKEGYRKYYFDNSDYERIKGRVVLQNGIYNIADDVLEEFDADSPFYYELNATYLEQDDRWLKTPTFDKVISDACEGDKESIKTIRQGLGVLLIPDKIKLIIVLGPASNSGKSEIGRLLEKIIPRSRILHISPTALRGRFALGNAENAILISCMDVDMEDISPAASGCIKRATGDDVILAERKHKDVKDIFVRFKFIFGTNGAFCTRQYDPGWVNRLFILPFIHELSDEEIDMQVPEKLEAEKDAIVTKLLRSMREVLMPDGSIKLHESPASKALKFKWIMQNNYFEDFFRQMIELTGNDLDNYSSEEVYEAYSRFFIYQTKQDKEYRNRHRLTKEEFISNLKKYGGGLIEKKRMSRNRKEHFKNAQHRMCGFLLKSIDIFDNDDRSDPEA